MELEDIECHPCRTIIEGLATDNWPRRQYGNMVPCTQDILNQVSFSEAKNCPDSPIETDEEGAQYVKSVIAER